jgi:hypothetical protein
LGSQGQSDVNGAAASNSNGGGRSSGWDNAGAQNEAQGASDRANSDLNGGDDNGPRRVLGDTTDPASSANYSNQIGALGAAQANGNVDRCRELRAELDHLTSDSAPTRTTTTSAPTST